MELLLDVDWLTDEMDKLWNEPGRFETGEHYEEPSGDLDERELYALFRLGVHFGMEYENEYPRDGEWRDNDD